jgi:hypothetical protein
MADRVETSLRYANIDEQNVYKYIPFNCMERHDALIIAIHSILTNIVLIRYLNCIIAMRMHDMMICFKKFGV